MSHRTTIALSDVHMTSSDLVERALEVMGITYTKNATIHSTYISSERVEYRLDAWKDKPENHLSSVGITRQKGKEEYEIVGDFYMLHDAQNKWLSSANFEQHITQAYHVADVEEKMLSNGYGIMNMSENTEGEMVMTFSSGI